MRIPYSYEKICGVKLHKFYFKGSERIALAETYIAKFTGDYMSKKIANTDVYRLSVLIFSDEDYMLMKLGMALRSDIPPIYQSYKGYRDWSTYRGYRRTYTGLIIARTYPSPMSQ